MIWKANPLPSSCSLYINKMKRAIGFFLLIVGLILLVVFFTIDQSERPLPGLFFSGLGGVFLGGLLVWRSRAEPQSSERFRSVRKAMQDKQDSKK
jgi:drug/metabolite transporter superfamily protein YnfA